MTTFRVPDMTCGHCTGSIGKAIAAVAPAARVEFALAENLVRISGASRSAAELKAAIETAGYTAAAVDAAPAEPRASGCGCGCGPKSAVDMRQVPAPAKGGCCV